MAHVTVTGDDHQPHQTVTDTAGRYVMTIRGTGIYEVRARAFGYTPLSVIVQRSPTPASAGGSRIERDLGLNRIAISLATVKVVASAPHLSHTAPADKSEDWQSFLTESFPITPGDLTGVATLQPGVVRTGSSSTDLSIAGQSPDQNRLTVDGADYSGTSLPAEGVRSAGVISNSYDVAHGQFSGGQIIATTISGTNIWGGALSARLTDPSLQYGGLQGGQFNDQRSLNISGGGGGALVADKLFVYGALDITDTRSPTSVTLNDPAALQRLQLSPDSARRFIDIANGLGVGTLANAAPVQSQSDFASLLTRIDYTLSRHQSLTARLDWRGSKFSGLGSSPLTLASQSSDLRTSDGGVLAQLTSAWSYWSNQFRVYSSAGNTGNGATGALPTGQVRVISSLDDGLLATVSLGFGGFPLLQDERHSLLEFADDAVRTTESGAHRFETGFILREQRVSPSNDGNRNGSFTFSSLDDLENGRPASFTRNLSSSAGTALRQSAGLYIGDTWNARNGLTLTYGIRSDAARYGSRAAPTATVAALAHEASTQIPSELILAPRLGFNYRARSGWSVDGGAGGFAGAPNLRSLALPWNATGESNVNLTCIGPAAPTPDWMGYIDTPGAIPTTCAGGTPVFSGSAPSATLFSRDFGSPRTWRASLGVTTPFGLTADVLVVHGTHLPSARDLNLAADPPFALVNEANRPVYAPASAFDPSTGGVAPGTSRIDPSLDRVIEVNSHGESWTEQLSTGVHRFIWRSLVGLTYTFTNSRTLEGGVPTPGAPFGTTAGNPARLEWVTSPYTPRHVFQLIATRGFARRFNASIIGRLASGSPFTPVVGTDINGDGFSNDRAFVFDAASAGDAALASAMAQLENTAPHSIRDCLLHQTGRIAAPGSCHTGWSPSLDLRTEMYALGDINSRRLMITLDASNVTAGLDYLLHGANDLRDWGQPSVPDATLLEVAGFNPASRALRYTVNSNFGRPVNGGIFRQPFRLTLTARVTVGEDPRYQPLAGAIRAGIGMQSEDVRASLEEYVHNVPAIVLRLAAVDSEDVLRLSLAQKAALQTLGDSLAPAMTSALDSLTASWMERGPTTAARIARLQQRSNDALTLMQQALASTRAILAPAQWATLPAWLTRPPAAAKLETPTFHATMSGSGP